MKKVTINNLLMFFTFFIVSLIVLFFRWYNNSNLAIYLSTLFMIVLFLLNVKTIKIKSNYLLYLFLICIYLILNITLTKNHQFIVEELLNAGIMTFSFAVLLLNIKESDNVFKNKYILKPVFWIFNIYYIINTYIIMKQIEIPGFMIRNFTSNNFYSDQIDGLLGSNGTHRLSFLCIALIFMNYSFMRNKSYNKSKLYKVMSNFMFWFIIITSCYFSIHNDNRMYYLLLVVFLLPIMFIEFKSIINTEKKAGLRKKIYINKKKLFLSILLIPTLLLIFFISMSLNQSFNNFITHDIYEQYIEKTYNKLTSGSSNANEGEERIILFKYALNEGNGYYLGKGLGAVKLTNDPNMPKHFGLNEMSSRIYNGGLIYICILIFSYFLIFLKYFKKNNKVLKCFIIGVIIIMAFYARIFTMPDETFLISLIFFFFSESMEGKIHEQ